VVAVPTNVNKGEAERAGFNYSFERGASEVLFCDVKVFRDNDEAKCTYSNQVISSSAFDIEVIGRLLQLLVLHSQ
jgi:predicted glycosyltransferase involved in capsule biosynthesis